MRRYRSIGLFGVALALLATIALAQDRRGPAAPVGATVIVGEAVEVQVIPLPKGDVANQDQKKKDDKEVDPNFAPLLQRFTQQFRPILRAELHLVRSVCELTDDQRRKIHAAGEAALKEAATKSAETQVKMMRGVAAGMMPDGRKSIQAAVSSAVKAHASAEQAARYEAELKQRTENQKRVAVRNSVAMIDEDLCLSAEQRDKISESLLAHWNDNLLQSIEMLQYGRRFLPPIPDQSVMPFLTETQKAVWQGNRETGQNFYGGMFFGGLALDNDPLEEAAPPPAEPPVAEPAPPARR